MSTLRLGRRLRRSGRSFASDRVLQKAVARWNADDFVNASSTDKYLWDRSGNGHDLRIGSAGTATVLPGYLRLPGATGNYLSTPDKAALRVTGDIDIRVWVALDSITSASGQWLVAKWDGSAANQRSYLLNISAAGNLQLQWTTDGTATTQTNRTCTVDLSTQGISVGKPVWLRATLDVDNGAGGRTGRFFKSDDGQTWTEMGVTQTTAGTTSIFSGTAVLELGALSTGTSALFAGRIFYAEVRSGIDGTVVAKADFSGLAAYTKSWADGLGNTWTVNQTVGATTNDPLFLRYDGEKYVYLPGAFGNYISTPDAADLRISGDIDLRVRVRPDVWNAANPQALVAKRGPGSTPGECHYQFRASAGYKAEIVYSPDGVNFTTITSTADIPYAAGVGAWLRVTRNATTGEVFFYHAPDALTEPTTWTQLGTTVTSPAGNMNAPATPPRLEIGSIQSGTGQVLTGRVYYASVRNGINGTLVAEFDASKAAQPYDTVTDSVGKVWTFNRSASGRKTTVVDRNLFLFGVDDYMDSKHHTRLDADSAAGFTFTSAVRRYGLQSTAGILLSKKVNGGTANAGWGSEEAPAGSVGAYFSDGVTQRGAPIAAENNPSGTAKVHAARAADAGVTTLSNFVNGVQRNSSTGAAIGSQANALDLVFGAANGRGGNFWEGEFFGAAIFRQALSDPEIARLNSEFRVSV